MDPKCKHNAPHTMDAELDLTMEKETVTDVSSDWIDVLCMKGRGHSQ